MEETNPFPHVPQSHLSSCSKMLSVSTKSSDIIGEGNFSDELAIIIGCYRSIRCNEIFCSLHNLEWHLEV